MRDSAYLAVLSHPLRLAVVSLLVLIGTTIGAQADTATPGASTGVGGMAMLGGNPARTGEMPGPGPAASRDPSAPLGVLWRFRVDDPVGLGQMDNPPAVLDGGVYFSSGSFVYAIDAATGAERWRVVIGNSDSSPAVVDGTVYVSGGSNLYALDATTGQERWRVEIQRGWGGSPAVVDGVVYVVGALSAFAIDGTTGMELWHFETEEPIQSSPTVADGVVYFHDTEFFFAVDAATGAERWRGEWSPDLNDVRPPALVADGVVYRSHGGAVLAFDASTGKRLWTAVPEPRLTPSLSALAAAGGLVYVGSYDPSYGAYLHAFDAGTGKLFWRYPIADSLFLPIGLLPPTVADHVIFVASTLREPTRTIELRAVNPPFGTELWRWSTEGEAASSLVVVGGVVYFATTDFACPDGDPDGACGSLYAVGDVGGAASPAAGTPVAR